MVGADVELEGASSEEYENKEEEVNCLACSIEKGFCHRHNRVTRLARSDDPPKYRMPKSGKNREGFEKNQLKYQTGKEKKKGSQNCGAKNARFKGHTKKPYSSQNGPGYGTMIRALILVICVAPAFAKANFHGTNGYYQMVDKGAPAEVYTIPDNRHIVHPSECYITFNVSLLSELPDSSGNEKTLDQCTYKKGNLTCTNISMTMSERTFLVNNFQQGLKFIVNASCPGPLENDAVVFIGVREQEANTPTKSTPPPEQPDKVTTSTPPPKQPDKGFGKGLVVGVFFSGLITGFLIAGIIYKVLGYWRKRDADTPSTTKTPRNSKDSGRGTPPDDLSQKSDEADETTKIELGDL